jgi:hypothetical protein
MTSLSDIFSLSFFVYLGITILIVALVVVYFESKMREQNHVINNMVLLTKTLVEEMNAVKFESYNNSRNIEIQQEMPIEYSKPFSSKIDVSDDESDEEYDDEEDLDEEDLDEEEFDVDDETVDESIHDIQDIDDDKSTEHSTKIIKIENNDYSIADSLSECLDEFDEEPSDDIINEIVGDDIPEINEHYIKKMLDIKCDTIVDEHSDLKTISILGDLESKEETKEEQPTSGENIDYKKLQLAKLRSIIIEKELASSADANKMKKHELLKLLGIE